MRIFWWKDQADSELDETLKQEDARRAIEQKNEFSETLLEVTQLRALYPVGTEFSVLGGSFLIKDVYSEYPSTGFSVKALYLNEITGFVTDAIFPIGILEQAMEK